MIGSRGFGLGGLGFGVSMVCGWGEGGQIAQQLKGLRRIPTLRAEKLSSMVEVVVSLIGLTKSEVGQLLILY